MTETRWEKVGTYTTEIEADEVTDVLDEAEIPYTRAGVLGGFGKYRSGSIEVHVPFDFVDAAKAAFIRALNDRGRPAVPDAANVAIPSASAPKSDAQFEHGRRWSRRLERGIVRVSIAVLAAAIGTIAFILAMNWGGPVLLCAVPVIGLALVAIIAAFSSGSNRRDSYDTRKDLA